MVLYFQILAYNKEKKNFIHHFIHRTSSQRLNINNFHSDMIFSPIPARKCIEMSAKSKNDHNNYFLFILMNINYLSKLIKTIVITFVFS